MRNLLQATACTLIVLVSGSANAEGNLAEATWGYSLQTGASVGTVEKPNREEDEDGNSELESEKITVGGFPIIFSAGTDYSNHIGVSVGGSVLFDLPNSQISSQALRTSVLWHVMGGAKKLVHGAPDSDYVLISQTSKQLSLVLQGAFIRYSASSKDLKVEATGSTFESRFGLRYRYSFGWINAGGIELLGSFMSIPADEERVESQTVELSFFWQV